MSNLQSLPLARAFLGVGADEDIDFSLAFFASDGKSPLSLAGITFVCDIGLIASLSLGSGITVSGGGFNILNVFVAAAAKQNWPNGYYPLSLAGSDGVYAKDVFAGSSLTIEPLGASPLFLSQIRTPGMACLPSLIAAIPNQVASNSAAIAELLSLVGADAPIVVASSQPITAPGLYLVTSADVTITLPDPLTWPGGAIEILDATQSSAPAITVVGTVNFDVGGAFIGQAQEGLTLRASAELNSWFII